MSASPSTKRYNDKKDTLVIKHLTAWSILAAASAAPAVAQHSIEQLAPSNSMAVVSVNDFQGVVNKLKATPLWGLWKSEPIQALVREPLEQLNEELDAALQELGVDRDTLVGPANGVGLAFFPAERGDEDGMPGFLAVIDYGDNFDAFDKIVTALIEQHEEEMGHALPEQDVLGRTVYTVDLKAMHGHADEDDDADDWDDDEWNGGGMGGGMGGMGMDPGAMVDQLGEVFFTRSDDAYLIASRLDTLHDALELIDEDGQSGLTKRHDFREARAQLGKVDGYGLVMVGDLLASMGQADPMMMMMAGMIQSVIGEINAIGFGVSMGGGDSMVEEKLTVYMPNGKSGLSKLLDVETPRGRVPSFVGPDVVSYSRVNFDFPGILGFLRNVAAANPMLGAEMNQWLLDNGPTIEKVTSVLGPEVHCVVDINKPLRIDSMRWLYAIESSKPEQVEQVVAQFAPDMQMEPRDFLGHRIYSMDATMGGGGGGVMGWGESLSIGFGSGYVMLGATPMVEDALRAGGRDGGPALTDDAGFRRALGIVTAPRSVSWGVMNVVDYLQYMMRMDMMTKEMEIQQFKQWDPEYAAELQQELDDMAKEPWRDFDVEIIDKYVGPVAWEIRATDEGFAARYMVLGPQKKE